MAEPLLGSFFFSIPSRLHSSFAFRGGQNTMAIYAKGHKSVILWILPSFKFFLGQCNLH